MSILYGNIQKHVLNETSIVNKYTGIAIREIEHYMYLKSVTHGLLRTL